MCRSKSDKKHEKLHVNSYCIDKVCVEAIQFINYAFLWSYDGIPFYSFSVIKGVKQI